MGKRNRSRKPGRQKPTKDPKPIIFVVCEGEVTEPEYLRGFNKHCRNPRVRIFDGGGVPRTIVERAKEIKQKAEKRARAEKDENLRYDEVWCVFDVDEHPSVEDAKQMAKENELELAISNPCIELWLLLHFRESPGMQDRHKLLEMMKKYIADYNKHVNFDRDYAAGYDDARTRAEKLDEQAALDHEENRNPTTGLWRLTESIRSSS